MEDKIISPCISICKSDPITGYCYGCARNNEEKKVWNNPDTSNSWKLNNLEILKNRLRGWQKDAFEQSYKYKQNEGISLFKKKLKETKEA